MSHPLRGFYLRDIPATRRLFYWACTCYSCWPFRAASRRFLTTRYRQFLPILKLRKCLLTGQLPRSPREPGPRAKRSFFRGFGVSNQCSRSQARRIPFVHRSRAGGRHSFAVGATRSAAASFHWLNVLFHFLIQIFFLWVQSGLVLLLSGFDRFTLLFPDGPEDRPGLPTCLGLNFLREQLEHGLRQRVRLSQHRGAALDQDVVFRVLGAFLRYVHIHDLAVRR
jgi:hypothetical protein